MNKRYISRYISVIFRHSQVYIFNRLKQYGIGRGHQSILMMLFEHGVMTQEQLAKTLKIDKANITRAIDKLETEGYVERKRCENDRRSYHIVLTEKAHAIKGEILLAANKWAEELTKDMNEEEQAQALALLSKMVENARNSDLCNSNKEE